MQAKFAPIVPPQFLRRLQDAGPEVFGSYHLLLAHEVLNPKFSQTYSETFSERDDIEVILDNSVAELGAPMTTDKLVEACEIVKPNIVVVPDVIGNASATIISATAFLDVVERLEEDIGCGFMLVPQGETLDGFMYCLDRLVAMYFPFNWSVGIPRIITNTLGTRQRAIEEVYKITHPSRVPIHLLGFSNNLMDDIACARRPEVVGIDSCVPFVSGSIRQLLTLDYPTKRPHRPSQKMWESIPSEGWTKNVASSIMQVRWWLGEIKDAAL